jgi:GT2 family glycosyltransferase
MNFVTGPATTVVVLAILVGLVANLVSMPRLRDRNVRRPSHTLVSVLIPARDEATTIATCLTAVLAQRHAHLEIIVLDDRSTDGTANVVRAFDDPRIKLIDGSELPTGWTGKNWACHQLAEAAAGEVLCFVDADTVITPGAVGAALELIEGDDQIALVTLLLAAEHRSIPEAVFLPIVNHALMALFPVWLMHRRSDPRVALALGPFVMVTRDAYDDVGGHASAPGEIVDDVRLARAVKATGRPVRLANGTDIARTRWYDSTAEIWRGFSKNAFGALDGNVMLAIVTVVVLVPVLCLPFARVGIGAVQGDVPADAMFQVVVLLTVRTITSLAGRDPVWSVLFHPVAIVFWGATLTWSTMLSLTDRTIEWRGRSVAVRSRAD